MRELTQQETKEASGGLCIPCAFIVASLARTAATRGIAWAASNTGFRFAGGAFVGGGLAQAGADAYKAARDKLKTK